MSVGSDQEVEEPNFRSTNCIVKAKRLSWRLSKRLGARASYLCGFQQGWCKQIVKRSHGLGLGYPKFKDLWADNIGAKFPVCFMHLF